MATVDVSAFSDALKELYQRERVESLVYSGAGPLYAWLPKDENFKGKQFEEVLIYGDPSGHSSSFSKAQANKSGIKLSNFSLTRVKYYSLVSLDSEVVLAADGDVGTMLNALESNIDGAINSAARSIGRYLYGDGSGQLGVINSSVAGATSITLSNASDVTNFEVGMKIVAADTTSAAPRDSGAAHTITDIDRDAGTLTVAVALDTTSPNIANGDLLFLEGTYEAASDRNVLTGLGGWVPDSAPGATAFFGVDRSSDVTRLGGIRIAGTGLSRSEALIKACARLGREGVAGAEGDMACFTSYDDFEGLVNEREAKLEHSHASMKYAGVGFSGIKVYCPLGVLEVYPDVNCPANKAYILHKKACTFRSLGMAPRILDLDGARMLREGSADALEVRIAYFAQMSCGKAPGYNCVITNFGS